MNIINELKQKFNIIEPIFDYEIKALGYSDEDISDTLKDGVFEELFGVDYVPCRIFYLVGYSELLGCNLRLQGCSGILVEKYFLGKDFEYGYYDGLTLENKLGLSTQMPFRTTIRSTRVKEATNIDYFYILPDEDYTRDDFEYICLAKILKFKAKPDYDITEKVQALKEVCTDKDKLKKYMERYV